MKPWLVVFSLGLCLAGVSEDGQACCRHGRRLCHNSGVASTQSTFPVVILKPQKYSEFGSKFQVLGTASGFQEPLVSDKSFAFATIYDFDQNPVDMQTGKWIPKAQLPNGYDWGFQFEAMNVTNGIEATVNVRLQDSAGNFGRAGIDLNKRNR